LGITITSENVFRWCDVSISRFCFRALEPPSVSLFVLLSFFKQELAHFSNDQRFVDYEHVVAGVMQ